MTNPAENSAADAKAVVPSHTLSSTADLTHLLSRVEGARGPDRELDALICAALRDIAGPADCEYVRAWSGPWVAQAGLVILQEDSGHNGPNFRPEKYTASLDAALALVERVLPGWTMACDATAPELGIDWELFEPGPDGSRIVGTHEKHPLALLAALLKALIAQQPPAPGEKT